MTIEALKAALEAAQGELRTRNTALEAANERVQAAAATDNLDELSANVERAAQSFDEQADEVARLRTNLADAERRAAVMNDLPAEQRGAGVPRVNSNYEPEVYSERSAAEGLSFVRDAWAFQTGNTEARERLERHGKQNLEQMRAKGVNYRSVGTSAFSGLTIPQYLVDLFAPYARAGAPTLAAVRKLPLPPQGMVLTLSRITTGAATAAQASQNSGVQSTDMSDTSLNVNIQTYAGQQDVSRQAIERDEMVDAVVFMDLIADYFTKVDAAILSGAGSSGTHLGITATSGIGAVTYTDSTPTVPELYPKVSNAIQTIASTRYMGASLAIVHPRRWGWMTAALDSNNRPLVVPNAGGPQNALAVGDAPAYGAIVGQMQGIPILTDANIPTNLGASTTEDQMILVRTPDLMFFQDGDGSPAQFRFEQSAAPQSIRLAVWGYSAFTAGRYPAAACTIGGTGLIAPTF